MSEPTSDGRWRGDSSGSRPGENNPEYAPYTVNGKGPAIFGKELHVYLGFVVGAVLFFLMRDIPLLAAPLALLIGIAAASADFKASLIGYLAVAPILHPIFSVEIPGLPLMTYSRLLLAGIVLRILPYFHALDVKRVRSFWLLFAFALSTAVTALLSDATVANLNSTFAYLIEFLLVLVLVAAVMNRSDVERMLKLIFVSYGIAVFFGLVELVRGESLFLNLISEGSRVNAYEYAEEVDRVAGIGRLYSLFEHPFAFGNFSAIASLYALGFYFIYRSRSYLLLFCLGAFPVLFSFSRASLVFWILGSVTFLLLNGPASRRWMIRILPVAILAGFLIVMATPLKEYFFGYFTQESVLSEGTGSTVDARISDVSNALTYMSQKIGFGYGEKTVNANVELGRFLDIGYVESNMVRKALSFGLVGFVLWISYHVSILRKLLKLPGVGRGDGGFQTTIAAVSIAVLINFLIHSVHSALINEQLLVVLINIPFFSLDPTAFASST